MRLILLLPIAFGAFLATLGAQTLPDDFNDNSRDASYWLAPFVNPDGNGEFLEVNERLELSTEGTSDGDVSQQFVMQPGYNQFWQVQIVVAVDEASILAPGHLGYLSIGVTKDSEGEASIDVGYACGDIPEIPTGKETVFAQGSDDAHPDGYPLALNATDLPEAIGVRLTYDPFTRMIRAYYDLDADSNDGEWTLLDSYTVDGSAASGAKVLDWGMSDTGHFIIELLGGSEGGAVLASGSAWVDDAELSLGRTIGQATMADDFDDNSRDTVKWSEPQGVGNLVETNERLEFSGNNVVENDVGQTSSTLPPYDSPWQVQMRASVDKTIFALFGQDASLAIDVGNTSAGGDEFLGVGYGAGRLTGFSERQAIFAYGSDGSLAEGLETLDVRDLPDVVAVRMTYDPDLRLIRTYYNPDESLRDSGWVPIQAFSIDGSSYPGAETLDWGMGSGDFFFIGIQGGSNNKAIPAGNAWVDDFQLQVGTSAQSEGGIRLLDDFNDDHLESPASALWESPQSDLGMPVFVDTNQRRELVVVPGTGENEIRQAVHSQFNPRYDQAFELKVEAHCLPAGLATEGQAAATELEIVNGNGSGEHLLFSMGALHNGASVDQILAISNSQVLPLDDEPDRFDPQPLPEVVGMRIAWNPETKVLSCYADTDGDRSVENWTLYADYTLDGSDQGTFRMSNWGMGASDRFVISLNGYSENVQVNSGEVYYDNFQLFIEPLPTGYELWAEGIPDGGLRGEDDDASGNGISNLFQYMFGLEPLSTRTDVLPRMEWVDGAPVLVHGSRAPGDPAPDYYSIYLESTDLGESGWSFVAEDSVETVEIGGVTFLRVTFPATEPSNFYRLEIQPNE